MECSLKKAATSACSSGLVSVFTPSTMRTMELLGKRSLASCQCSRTAFQATAPWSRLAMARVSRKGAFWVFTSGPKASSVVRSICDCSGNSARA